MWNLPQLVEVNKLLIPIFAFMVCDQPNCLTDSIKNIYGFRIVETFQEVVDIKWEKDYAEVTRELAFIVQADSICLQIGSNVLLLRNARSINLKNQDRFDFIVVDYDSVLVSELELVKSELDSIIIYKSTAELSNRIQIRKRYLSYGIDVWIPNEVDNKVIYFIDSNNIDYLPWKFWLP